MKKSLVLLFLLLISVLFSKDWDNAVSLSFSSISGNTDVLSYSLGLNSEVKGDIHILGVTMYDSEYSLSAFHAKGDYKNTLYEHNGKINMMFDYQANQTFSPFIFTSWEYDSLAALDNRSNIGLGAKLQFNHGLSISLAGLWENEKYMDQSSRKQARLSLRSKYSGAFESGTKIKWTFYYQPLVEDYSNYLINQSLKISLKTQLEWLDISLIVTDNFNSSPPEGVKKEDLNVTMGFKIIF